MEKIEKRERKKDDAILGEKRSSICESERRTSAELCGVLRVVERANAKRTGKKKDELRIVDSVELLCSIHPVYRKKLRLLPLLNRADYLYKNRKFRLVDFSPHSQASNKGRKHRRRDAVNS